MLTPLRLVMIRTRLQGHQSSRRCNSQIAAGRLMVESQQITTSMLATFADRRTLKSRGEEQTCTRTNQKVLLQVIGSAVIPATLQQTKIHSIYCPRASYVRVHQNM